MSSVHNVKRLKKRRLGVVTGAKAIKHTNGRKMFQIECVICHRGAYVRQLRAETCGKKCSARKQYLKNKEIRIEMAKKYYVEHKEQIRAYKSKLEVKIARRKRENEWIKNKPIEWKEKKKAQHRKYQHEHLAEYRKYNKKSRDKNYKGVLEASKQYYVRKMLGEVL